MPFIQLGENYIIVMGKDADGADTDGRIAWLQGVYGGYTWQHTIHYFLMGTHAKMQYNGEKDIEWLEPLSTPRQVFDADNGADRQ